MMWRIFTKPILSIPVAFEMAGRRCDDIERRVRTACRHLWHTGRLMDRILPDIAEVLNAGDDLGEDPEEAYGANCHAG